MASGTARVGKSASDSSGRLDGSIPPLVAGDKLTREEFLRRWEKMPELKRAELIGGIVYMPSAVRRRHGTTERHLSVWLGYYEAATPGLDGANNTTWFMLADAPQPDADLRILPEFGGQSGMKGPYSAGAPELAAEACLSSTAYDLHQKLELYQAAGVKEYLAVLLREQKVRWHRLVGNAYQVLPTAKDGVIRSVVFPGLWLHVKALLTGDVKHILEVLDEGLRSPEHAEFVAQLKKRRK